MSAECLDGAIMTGASGRTLKHGPTTYGVKLHVTVTCEHCDLSVEFDCEDQGLQAKEMDEC